MWTLLLVSERFTIGLVVPCVVFLFLSGYIHDCSNLLSEALVRTRMYTGAHCTISHFLDDCAEGSSHLNTRVCMR